MDCARAFVQMIQLLSNRLLSCTSCFQVLSKYGTKPLRKVSLRKEGDEENVKNKSYKPKVIVWLQVSVSNYDASS